MTAINVNPDDLVQAKTSTAPAAENLKPEHHASSSTVHTEIKTSTTTVHSTETIKGLTPCDKLCAGETFQFRIKGLCSPVCDQIFVDSANPIPAEIKLSTAAHIVGRVKDMYHSCDNVCTCVCTPVCDEICDNIF